MHWVRSTSYSTRITYSGVCRFNRLTTLRGCVWITPLSHCRHFTYTSYYRYPKHHFCTQNSTSSNNTSSATTKQTVSQPSDTTILASKAEKKQSLLTRLTNGTYNFFFALFDSIIHPSNGIERLRKAWNYIKHEAKHFWAGSKLLWTDIKQARKIVFKAMRGSELTYRERRQLHRTLLDILRMIPFAFFIIVPFMDFLLPVALILFPNMLPSTFKTQLKKQQDRKNQLQLRLNIASFLESTLEKFSNDLKQRQNSGVTDVQLLDNLVVKLRNNEDIPNTQILHVAGLFDDHITLDNADSTQLGNLCRYMELNPFGPPAMLRMRLHSKIRELRREDRGIRREGVDNVPLELLKQLLRERGMRCDLDEDILRRNMKRWLELSLDHHVPVSLLIISRIFTLQDTQDDDDDVADSQDAAKTKTKTASDSDKAGVVGTTEAESVQLRNALGSVTEQAVQEAIVAKIGVMDPEIEKKVVERQAQLIADENEMIKQQEELLQSRKTQEDKNKQILDLATALETLASDSAVTHEREELQLIKQRLVTLVESDQQSINEVETQSKLSVGIDSSNKMDETDDKKDDEQLKESESGDNFAKDIKTQTKFSNRLSKMLNKIETNLDKSEQKIGNKMKVFENEENMTYEQVAKVIEENFKEELGLTAEDVKILVQELDVKKDGILDKQEIAQFIQLIKENYDKFSRS